MNHPLHAHWRIVAYELTITVQRYLLFQDSQN